MKISVGKYSMTFGAPAQQRQVQSRYDAAQTNHMNKRHWANADNLSADQANNPGVRKTLRERARYEISNDPNLGAMVKQYAHDVVGTGPRMEFMDEDADINIAVEQAWLDWWKEIKGTKKLKMLFQTSVGDGESFLVETNRKNKVSGVRLSYLLLDAERCTNSESGYGVLRPRDIDGVILDKNSEPIAYDFLESHPGAGATFIQSFGKTKRLRADSVIHFFQPGRPEQHRGVPEVTSALPLGSKMRSFTLSTVDAARIASMFSGVLHTTAATFEDALTGTGGTQSDGSFKPFDEFSLENGMFLTLPEGYDMRQVKAENPSTSYVEFQKSIISTTARSVLMPYLVASGDASGHNFASANMDRLSWEQILFIRQNDLQEDVLSQMFMSYWNEATLVEGELPAKVRRFGYRPKFKWFFDGVSVIDSLKEAKSDETNLKSGATNFSRVMGKKGLNWKDEMAQRAEEKAEMERLNLSFNDLIAETTVEPGQTQDEVQASVEQIVEEILDDRLIQ